MNRTDQWEIPTEGAAIVTRQIAAAADYRNGHSKYVVENAAIDADD